MRGEVSKPAGAVRYCGPSGPALLSVPQRNLTELVVAVTDENIVGLFAALLAERRVMLTASKLSTVRQTVPAVGGRGAGRRGCIPTLNSSGDTYGQNPGSAPLKVRVELNPGSVPVGGAGSAAAPLCELLFGSAEFRLHPLWAITSLALLPGG